jgi:hypothetical protein
MHTFADVRKAFLEFTQQFFASGRVWGVQDDQRLFQWDPDRSKTGVIIAAQGVELNDQLSKTPAIVVARGRIASDNVGGIGKGLDGYDWDEQKSGHVELYNVPIYLHCLSSNDEESEVLAQIVWFMLWFHRDMLKARHKFRGIDFGAIDTPRILKSGEGTAGPKLWDTAIMVTVHFHVTYTYRTHGPGTGVNEETLIGIRVPFIREVNMEGIPEPE